MIATAAAAQDESLSAYMTEASLMRAAWELGHAAGRGDVSDAPAYEVWRAELEQLRLELARLDPS